MAVTIFGYRGHVIAVMRDRYRGMAVTIFGYRGHVIAVMRDRYRGMAVTMVGYRGRVIAVMSVSPGGWQSPWSGTAGASSR